MMHTPHPWRGIRPWKRHSLVLLVAGMVYILIGGGYAFSEPTPPRNVALHYALHYMGYQAWGAVFIFAGLLAVVSSRWPPISETWGYSVLTGLSTGWSLFFAAGFFFWKAPASVLNQSLIFGLLAFLWWAISGLKNEVQVVVIMEEPSDDG